MPQIKSNAAYQPWNTHGRIFAARFFVWVVATFLAPLAALADYTATVSPGSVLVTNYQGWGSSLCWWANVIGGYANRSNYVDLAFDQLKLNIVRYNIGGGENPASNNITSYRAIMQGFEPTNGVWNWNADLNQRWVLHYALAHGANLVDAFANSPPWWMTVSGSVTGAVGATNNLQTNYEVPFATYLATVVSNLTVLDGDHFNYLTPMNEPNGSKWYSTNTSQEGCDMNPAQQARIVNDLYAALDTSAPSVKIDAAEDVDPYQTYADLTNYSTTTLGYLSLFTTHTYSETGASSLASEAVSQKKTLWVAEYGDSDGTGLTMAQRIHDDLTGMDVAAWCYWQMVDNASGWGFLYNTLVASNAPTFTTNYTVNEKFYVMGQFSEFIRPGCKIISVNDSSTVAAYTSTNSTLVLVTVNTNSTNLNVTYNLSGFGSVPWQMAVYRTSAGTNLLSVPGLGLTNEEFKSVIPAKSVTTFVLTTNTTPPTIVEQVPTADNGGLALYAGQSPAFSVTAAGTLPLSYQWLTNGGRIAGATNANYTPTAAQLSHITNFDCIVTNVAGAATSVWSVSVVPVPTAPYPRAVLALNPIGYWRLNETEQGNGDDGVVAQDFVGGNNGIYDNVVLGQPGYSSITDPAETSAWFGTVLSSNCAAGQIEGFDFSTPSGSNAEFSVAAWVNGTGAAQNGNAGIVTKGYFYGEELDLDEGAPGSDFRFVVRSAAGTAYSASSSINADTDGGWHHLVGVCDEANSNVLLYVDGVLAGSATIPAKSGITNSSAVPMTIGARAQSATSGNNQQFVGWINDVTLYNYALSSNQVQTIYQAGFSLEPVMLTITNLGGTQVELNWSYGTLQQATNADGPYNDITNAIQPHIVTVTNSRQFYRVREN